MYPQTQLYFRLSDQVDRSNNALIHSVVNRLLDARIRGLVDLIPAYNTLLLEFDPKVVSRKRLRTLVDRFMQGPVRPNAGRLLSINVVYDGPDLPELAASANLTIGEVIRRHSAPEYLVYAVGFTPGFPFLGDVDTSIRMPRLGKPRVSVPPGSVGIADGQTGIYPLNSPGGWRILGRTTERVYDPHRDRPFLLEPGDRARFVPTATGPELTPAQPLKLLPDEPHDPVFIVRKAGLLDLVLDRGRRLVGRFGLARSGPIDPTSSRIASSLVSNMPDDPFLEFNVVGPTLEVLRDVVVAFAGSGVTPHLDGEPIAPYRSVLVKRGQVLAFPPGPVGRRGYLALAGGIQSEQFRGSASVDVRGLIGRPLRVGDLIGTAKARTPLAGYSFHPYVSNAPTIHLRLLRGPQYDPHLVAALCRQPLQVESSDRMGIRLAGVSEQGSGVTSEGNPLGAVQLTGDGHPIILLNDRGTMGGYTKPAIVDPQDLGRLAQARDGDWVKLTAR